MGKMSVQFVLLAIILSIICILIPIITPSRAQNDDGYCWNNINRCIVDHASRSVIEPKYDPASPSFNMTDFLCCPLIAQTAQNNKECFCVIDTVIHQDPSLANNVTNFLSLCTIVDNSTASLDNFCHGIAPTPAEAPLYPTVEAPMMPVLPPL